MNDSLFSTGKNDWETPLDLFYELHEEFHFTLDPCCTPETAKCAKYYTEEDNGLIQNWDGEVVFCNPPYSSGLQDEWVKKCYEHGLKGYIAVMLIPARTDTKRFHEYILKPNVEVRYLKGRLKFGQSENSAPFPSMVVIFGKERIKSMTNIHFRAPESYLPDTELTLVVVDYSNLLYRAWFVSGQKTWIAYCKFFDMLRLCVKRSKQAEVPIKVIFAGESKTKLNRKKIDPHYKGQRPKNEDPNFAEYRKGLAELIQYLGWDILSVDGAEADDVIASIVAKYCHRCKCKKPCGDDCTCAQKYKTDVVIFSGDRDIQQCLAWDRTFVYRAPGLFVTKDDFEAEHGIPVAKYNVYKALIGDKSDNIKGVEGFGPVKAKTAIKANSVAEDIYEMRGHEGTEEFRLALSLVNLDYGLDVDIQTVYGGAPIMEGNMKIHEKVLFEINRLKEEF